MDFVGKRMYATVFSLAILLISIVLFVKPGPNWGIDFVGGTEIMMRFTGEVDIGELRGSIDSLNLGDVQIQRLGMGQEPGTGGNDFLIRVEKIEAVEEEVETGESGEDSAQKKVTREIEEKVKEMVGSDGYIIMQVNYVGPRVGVELKQRGIQAVLYAIIGILIYVALRFEFRFALGAVAALVHDAIISTGVFVFLNKEFNLAIIAALLAIIGYSVNDTIVVYDRIRENMRRLRRLTFIEMVNVSVNETLSRTLLTSTTTLIAVLFLWFLGGGVIRDFSLILFVGIIIGTYSTIYIASSIIIFWESMRAGRRTAAEPIVKKG